MHCVLPCRSCASRSAAAPASSARMCNGAHSHAHSSALTSTYKRCTVGWAAHCVCAWVPFTATAHTFRLNSLTPSPHLLLGTLLSAVRAHTVDLCLFNPPYVPTSDEEYALAIGGGDVANAALAGGRSGRRMHTMGMRLTLNLNVF
jgi:hypothetical protein